MPISVTQPKDVKVSTEHGELIKVSVVKGGAETIFITSNDAANSNIVISQTPKLGELTLSDVSSSPTQVSITSKKDDVKVVTLRSEPGKSNIEVNTTVGPQGPQGPRGLQGPPGLDGTDGADGSDGGVLSSAITILNTDAAFSHMTTPIAAGTTIESVLRDMLERYTRTTISMPSITRALQGTDGSYASASTLTSNETLEVGRGVIVSAFTISIGDSSQTTDNSVKFLRGSTEVETGFSDTSGTKTLSSADTQDPGTVTSISYKSTVIDDGGPDLGDETLSSGTISISWKNRIKVGAASTASINSNATAQTLFDTGLTTAFNQLRNESDFNVTANAAMDTDGNFTWVAYPASFGNLNRIDLAGTDVLSDFESPVDYNLTNSYGVTTSYRFYRSTFSKAFATGQVITIDF